MKKRIFGKRITLAALTLCAGSVGYGQTRHWDGINTSANPNTTSSNWSSTESWAEGVVPNSSGATVSFGSVSGIASTTPNMNSTATVLGIVFENGANAYTFGGNSALTLGANGIVNNSTATQIFNNNLRLDTAQTWNASSGALTINGTISPTNSPGALTLTLTGNSATASTIGAAISNGNGNRTVSLTKNGTGTWKLTGDNSFSGSTAINGGTLEAGANNALANTTSIQINNGGTLLLSGSSTTRVNNAATITLGATGGNINLQGTSEQLGALTLTSPATGTYSITLGAINSGTANLSIGTLTGPGTIKVYNWNQGDLLTFSSVPSTNPVTFQFYSDGGSTPLFGNYNSSTGVFTSTPVPEPSTVLAGIALVGFLGWRERRRVSSLLNRSKQEDLVTA